MQGGWGNMPPMPMDGNVGPIRKGTGRFNNRSGPYDRQGRGGRRGGRLSPPNSAKRFPDAAQTNAPREATAGRSLKSYEDLDAVGGSVVSNGGGTASGDTQAAGGPLDY